MKTELRLIDANALDALGELPYVYNPVADGSPWYRADDVWECIEKEPTVEIVHCRECKHWRDGVAGCTDHVKCCAIGFYFVGENGYCVYGEAKDG